MDAPPGKVPVAPIREAFERSGKGYQEVAAALGWYDALERPDGSRLRRRLGAGPQSFHRRKDGTRGTYTTEHLGAELASIICDAIGVMPVEIGL